jgi:hypothetical protein
MKQYAKTANTKDKKETAQDVKTENQWHNT